LDLSGGFLNVNGRELKMKTLVNLGNGVFTITEQGGVFKLEIQESKAVGGGKAAGILSVAGDGVITLSAQQALLLAEAFANSKVPAPVEPILEAVEAVANPVIEALE
jgi:hypothetical protein